MTENIQSIAFYGGPADLQSRLIMNYKSQKIVLLLSVQGNNRP